MASIDAEEQVARNMRLGFILYHGYECEWRCCKPLCYSRSDILLNLTLMSVDAIELVL